MPACPGRAFGPSLRSLRLALTVAFALAARLAETGHRSCVIWLQGFYTNASAYEPWLNQLKGARFPSMHFLKPEAPLVSYAGQEPVHSWFKARWPIKSRDKKERIDEGVKRVQKAVKDCKALGVATNRIVLAGHEQGGALGLAAGLQSAEVLGGIVMLSGWVPSYIREARPVPRASWRSPIPSSKWPPILWLHGGAPLANNYVPLKQADLGVPALKAMGANVEYKVFPDLTASSIVGFPDDHRRDLSAEQVRQAREARVVVARWLEKIHPQPLVSWLIDSGATNHTIARNLLTTSERAALTKGERTVFATPHGLVISEERTRPETGSFDSGPWDARVIPASNSRLLSLGLLIEHGYEFTWSEEEGCFLRAPSGDVFHCDVRDSRAHLDIGMVEASDASTTLRRAQ